MRLDSSSLRLVVAELRMMKEVYALSPRQRRILAGLTRGDLIWEVPDKSYFTQFNEATGRDGRLRLDELRQSVSSPWRADEKQAAMAAWVVLHR